MARAEFPSNLILSVATAFAETMTEGRRFHKDDATWKVKHLAPLIHEPMICETVE